MGLFIVRQQYGERPLTRSLACPASAADIGPLILLVFFATLVMAVPYVFFFVPETKGLSLEQVDELYRSGVKPWNSAKWQPTHGAARRGAFQKTVYGADGQNGEAANHTKGRPSIAKDEVKVEDEKIEHASAENVNRAM